MISLSEWVESMLLLVNTLVIFWVAIDTFHLILTGETVILTLLNKYIKRNVLMECKKCKRLFREYQRRFYKMTSEKENSDNCYYATCPHCERKSERREVENKDWMTVHPDCPRITIVSYRRTFAGIKNLKKLRKQEKDMEYFERYNKMKVDYKWIDNLKKERK